MRFTLTVRLAGCALAAMIALSTTACGQDDETTDSHPSTTRPTQTVPTPSGGGPTTPTRPTPPGNGTVPTTRSTQTPRTAVPDILVGTWDGGSRPANAKLTFTRDGYVRRVLNNGISDQGTVVVQGSSMTMYLSHGAEPIRRWSVERLDAGYGYTFLTLSLDGYSYVRQISS